MNICRDMDAEILPRRVSGRKVFTTTKRCAQGKARQDPLCFVCNVICKRNEVHLEEGRIEASKDKESH